MSAGRRLTWGGSGFALLLAALVSGLSGEALAAGVTLGWDAVTTPGVAGYVLYYGTTSGSYSMRVDVHNQTTYALAGLTPGTRYSFTVVAYDGSGVEGAQATPISDLPPLPAGSGGAGAPTATPTPVGVVLGGGSGTVTTPGAAGATGTGTTSKPITGGTTTGSGTTTTPVTGETSGAGSTNTIGVGMTTGGGSGAGGTTGSSTGGSPGGTPIGAGAGLSSGGAGSASGGGCTVSGSGAVFDPTLPFVAMLAATGVALRSRRAPPGAGGSAHGRL